MADDAAAEGPASPVAPLKRKHFGTSKRAARRAAAAAASRAVEPAGAGDDDEAAELERRYRYVVHAREHTLVVPMLARASVRELLDVVNERVTRRKLAKHAVVDLHVRTDAGAGLLDPSDRLESVITERDELVAVFEDSHPVSVAGVVPRASEVLAQQEELHNPRREPNPSQHSASYTSAHSNGGATAATRPPGSAGAAAGAHPDGWDAPVVRLTAVKRAEQPDPASFNSSLTPPSMRSKPASATAKGGSGRRSLSGPVPDDSSGSGSPSVALNTAGKQRKYLEGVLAELNRSDLSGVPEYKRRLLDELMARSMHDTAAERPLLKPSLKRRSLRAMLDAGSRESVTPPPAAAASTLPAIGRAGSATSTAATPAALATERTEPPVPRRARSAEERALARLHGTPEQFAAAKVEERERRVYYYHNAISKLELDALEIADREEQLRAELDEVDAEVKATWGETKQTPLQLLQRREAHRALTSTKLRQAETRISEAQTTTRGLKERINHQRKELKIFVTKLRHVKERDAELSKDVRTLTALTQAQLDDRQKVRMRIERLQHEHRTEAKFFAKQRVKHDAELVAIDERIAARRQAIEQLDDTLKLANYVRTADYAKTVRRRELRSGRQRDHIEWFQRQATRMEELINVPFRPEEPGGAAGTIKYFREQEAHAASLWSKINDREREAAELGVEIRALEAEVAVLSHAGQGEPAEGNDDGVFDGFGDDSSPVFASTQQHNVLGGDADEELFASLQHVLPVVERMFELLGCDVASLSAPAQDGVAPPTVCEYIDAIGKRLRELQLRVRQMKGVKLAAARERFGLAPDISAAEILSPRAHDEFVAATNFGREHRAVLDALNARFDVIDLPYDMEEEFQHLAIEQSRRELQEKLDKRADGHDPGLD